MKIRYSLTFVLFFLLLIFNFIYSQSSQSPPGTLEQRYIDFITSPFSNILINWLTDWKTLAVTGLAIAIIFTVIMYMLGEAFDIQILKYYFRIEAKDLIANVLVVIFFVSFLSLIDYAANLFTVGGNQVCNNGFCFDDLVYNYVKNAYAEPLTSQVKELNKAIAKSMYSIGGNAGFDSIYVLYLTGGSGVDYSYSNVENYLLRSVYEFAFLGLNIFLLSLKIASGYLPLVLITLGIFLRTFFFTKRFGSTLMAVGFGMMVVYPFFTYLLFIPFLQPLSSYQSGEDSLGCPSLCISKKVVASKDLGQSNPPASVLSSDISNEIRDCIRTSCTATINYRDGYKEQGSNPDFISKAGNALISGTSLYTDQATNEDKEELVESVSFSFTNSVDKYNSCEYLAINTLRAYKDNGAIKVEGTGKQNIPDQSEFFNSQTSKDIIGQVYSEPAGYKYGLYCFSQCRYLPYPDDSVECRDAEPFCRVFYNEHPECFTKVYAENQKEYKEIVSFYIEGEADESYDTSTYDSDCSSQCKGLKALVPPFKMEISGKEFCPTQCREIDVKYTEPTSGSYDYLPVYSPNSLFLNPICLDSSKYDCTSTSDPTDMNTYDKFYPDNENYIPYNSEDIKGNVKGIENWKDALKNRNPTYYDINVVDYGESGCNKCLNYPEPLRYDPIYVDCSACSKNNPTTSLANSAALASKSVDEIGKALLVVYGIPLLSIVITIYSISGLSAYMSGDMFIPAIDKLVRGW